MYLYVYIVKWEGAHRPYLQLGELNCEGRSSRGLVEGIVKTPRAAALRPNAMEHSYDGGVQPALSTFQVGGNRSTWRKPTTFGRALTNFSHMSVASPKRDSNPRSRR